MTNFTDLMHSLQPSNDGFGVTVSDDWLQGRTVYGGLAAALCLQGALNAFADLPPLRSAQIAFIGPASGALQITPRVLRKGKSTVFVGVDLAGEAGLATRATFCFGAARASAFAHSVMIAPDVAAPETCPDFFRNAPPGLAFVKHFDGRFVGGALPFSGAEHPEMTLWLRHRGAVATSQMVALLALADAPPPAASTMANSPSPISTMTWAIDLLTDKVETADGWWLVRNAAEQIADGYSSQAMTVWNANGVAVMASRQNVAVFG
jgi:acyl-CoA thioesterase